MLYNEDLRIKKCEIEANYTGKILPRLDQRVKFAVCGERRLPRQLFQQRPSQAESQLKIPTRIEFCVCHTFSVTEHITPTSCLLPNSHVHSCCALASDLTGSLSLPLCLLSLFSPSLSLCASRDSSRCRCRAGQANVWCTTTTTGAAGTQNGFPWKPDDREKSQVRRERSEWKQLGV